jgi:hypothetical protein
MKISATLFALVLTMFVLTGCGAIETIFKAGMAWAFFLVAIVIIIVIVVINKAKK